MTTALGLVDYAVIAAWANVTARLSRRAGAPKLSATSPRETLIEWLTWNDANGCYTDDAAELEGADPLTVEDAWKAIADAMRDDEPYTWRESGDGLLDAGWYVSDEKGRRGPFASQEAAAAS